MPRRYYSSTAVATTLSGSINNSTTSVTVTALSGFPNTTPWTALIDKDTASEEVVTVTAVAGTTLTVTRGVDGTSAVSHNAGAGFSHGVSARDFDETNSHVNDTTTDVHSQYVLKSLVNAKGDLVTATANDTPAILTAGSNGQVLVADSSQTNGLRYRAPFMSNHIINGGFDVWQRGTSGTTTSGIGFPSADRWNAWTLAAGGSVTLSRQTVSDSTNLPNARYCGRFQRVSGNTNTGTLVLGQALETSTSIQMAGQSVTLSFWIRTGANFSATSMSGEVWSNTTTDSGLNTVQSGSSVLASATVTPSSTWTRYTATGTVSSSATQIAVAFAYTPTGTAGANDWFEITGVQLETGPVATPFEFEPYEATLRKCQRYYQVIAEGNDKIICNTMNYSATSIFGAVDLPVSMRTTPTISQVTGTDYYKWEGNGTNDGFDSMNTLLMTGTTRTGMGTTSGVSVTQGHAGWFVTNSASSFLALQAEL